VGAAVALLFLHHPRSAQPTYRIGWQLSPPYQVAGNEYPTGLAPDLIREAARRRGVKLTWVYWKQSSESALRTRNLDLWPLITMTPERLAAFHITEPYIQVEHTLLVRADSAFHTAHDLAMSRIGLANSSIDGRLLRGFLPNSQMSEKPRPRMVLEEVCKQNLDAGFMDISTAIATLLQIPGCDNALRWISVPEIKTRMGIGSTAAASAVADALRDEIGVMARDGAVAPIIGKWGYTPAENLISLEQLVDVRRRVERLAAISGLFALLFGAAFLQSVRFRRERNRATERGLALRAAEQKLRVMANNLREMVLAFDMDRKLIYANPAVENLTGYPLDEYTMRGFIDWVHPDDHARMLTRWEDIFKGSSFQDEEYRLLRRDGALRWVSASWGPILDETGTQVGVQGSEHDITDRKRAEEALRESQERYLQAQKMESIGRLAGGVAHDFNNLLTVINGYSDMIQKDLPAGHELGLAAGKICLAGQRAAELTKQLLAFSRRQIVAPLAINLNSVVTECRSMAERLLGEEIQVTVTLEPSLGMVMADPGQMHQVLMNLLVNARDAMPGGGCVFVRTKNVEVRGSSNPDSTPGPAVLLEIVDFGVGMTEETRRNLFEPFFTTKGIGNGTGLGLATVYGIVRQSQGWIDVHSELGKGTSFHIYLPRTSDERQPESVAEPEAACSRGAETVLIVEDQSDLRCLAVQILESAGYRTLEAVDGPRALEIAQSFAGCIDVLVTDVVLPGMNGRQLAERLRAARPDVKVLYTSGYTYDVIAHRGVLDDDISYLPKPYSPNALRAKVRNVISAAAKTS